MAGTMVIALEGVLRNKQGQPIPQGLALYHGMKTVYKIVIAVDDLSRAQAEHWLQVEGLRDHIRIICADVALGGNDVRYEQLRTLGGLQMRPDMVIEPSPARVAAAVSAGYTTVLFTQPSYARPEWRADSSKGVKAWASIEEELTKQAEQKARDPRVDAEMTTP